MTEHFSPVFPISCEADLIGLVNMDSFFFFVQQSVHKHVCQMWDANSTNMKHCANVQYGHKSIFITFLRIL